VLLVGGPTQMPYVREGLSRHLGATVDYSLDPMTVVARGACIYGTTIERTAVEATPAPATASEKLPVRLAFDAVSATTQTYVAGRITPRAGVAAHEVRIDSDNNFWTSGWHPVKDELFDIAVTLQEGLMNRFRLSVRDAQGRTLEVEPAEFSIRHGLTISAPPLPHTISVELVQADGTATLSPIFPRKTLLPAETTVSYRAAHTLRPSEEGTSLAIKLWEGEAHTDPQANNWVGNMHIRNEHIRRPIPEGVEIQIHIKIDASRLITVEAFVPHLNEHFTEKIFIPQEEEPDYVELLKGVPLEIESYFVRLNNLETYLITRDVVTERDDEDFPEILYEEGDFLAGELQPAHAAREESPREELERLRREVEDFDIEITASNAAQNADPDYAKGIVERSRELRVRVANLERRAGIDPRETRIEEAASLAREIGDDVTRYGNEAQKQRFDVLSAELRRAQERADNRGIKKAVASLKNLRGQVLYAQDWFWKDWFSYMQRPGRRFVNTQEAAKWLAQGERALETDDRPKLEEAVRWLWSLEPVEDREAEKERNARPGLRS
jgi:molecular chaperone DnaK